MVKLALVLLALLLAIAVPAHGATHASCPATRVQYGKDTTVGGGLRPIPWLVAGPFHAHLFFYGATPWPRQRLAGAHIFTTVKKRNVNPKILWTLGRPVGQPTLAIKGTRLDAPGHFTGTATRVSGNQFPSYVEVPRAGCWRVDVTSGTQHGSVTFVAVDKF
jgi:hypothetical protein